MGLSPADFAKVQLFLFATRLERALTAAVTLPGTPPGTNSAQPLCTKKAHCKCRQQHLTHLHRRVFSSDVSAEEKHRASVQNTIELFWDVL